MYNGRRVAKGWPERIEAAQLVTEYLIGGAAYPRVALGKEQNEWPDGPCHDCGVRKGQYHVELICDAEECPLCHGQVIGCDFLYDGDSPAEG
jgi:hypothetical protein